MTLESNKNLGGIGAILMFIGVLPVISFYGITSLVGLILVLIAMYGLANYYNESGIFNKALYGAITAIVGIVVAVAIFFTAAIGFLSKILPNWNGDWASLLQINLADISTNIVFSDIAPFLAMILLGLVILYVAAIITALFLRKSLGLLSAKTGVGLFGTTGLLILIGAIIPIIGLLLIWIALLLLAAAFFSIRPQQAQLATPTETPTSV